MIAEATELSSSEPSYPQGFGVNVVGFISASLGLAVAARATIAALIDAGVPVAVADIQLQGRSGLDGTYAHLQVRDASRLPHPVTLVHLNPVEATEVWRNYPQWFAHTYNCSVPFWELADLQERWIAPLSEYDAVLAASDHIAGAVRNAVATRVRPFPIAARVEDVEPVERGEFGIPEGKIAFAASWDTDSGLNRKNGFGVLRAFAAALDFGADAVLVIKLNGNTPHPQFVRALAELPADRVVAVTGYLPYPRVLGLYAACDAYISLHRAEGLGLGLQEAMLLGKPVIATGWSGNMGFMDESSAALVRYTLTPAVDAHPEYAPSNFARTQLWAEPDVLDAAHHIYRLTADAEQRASIGAAGRDRMVRYRDAWKRTAPQRLAGLYADHLRNG